MRRRMGASGPAGGRGSNALRPSLNLLAAALAGAVNQAFTLPLENITTRMQTAQHTPAAHHDDPRASALGPHTSTTATCGGSGDSAAYGGIPKAVVAKRNGSSCLASSDTKEKIQGQEAGGFSSKAYDSRSASGCHEHAGLVVVPVGQKHAGNMAGNNMAHTGVGLDPDPGLPGIAQLAGVASGTAESGSGMVGREGTCESNHERCVLPSDGLLDGCGDGEDGAAEGKWTGASLVAQHQLREPRQQQRPRGRPRRQSLFTVAAELYREGRGIGRFWRGFAPSLILTCNPAINYTAFDLLKALWLRRRAAYAMAAGTGIGGTTSSRLPVPAAGAGATPRGAEGFLNPVEAFLVAAAAKSLATLITYPLIRAKVVLMTSSFSSSALFAATPSASTGAKTTTVATPLSRDAVERLSGVCEVGEDEERVATDISCMSGVCSGIETREDASERLRRVSRESSIISLAMGEGLVESGVGLAVTAAAEAEGEGRCGENDGGTRGMGSVLVELFRQEGLGGLYAGCGAQVCLVFVW